MGGARSALQGGLLVVMLGTGCASSTVIRSRPTGATVRSSSGAALGKTPYEHSDTQILGHKERFTLELEGHQPAQLSIERNQWDTTRAVGFGIGGFFFTPLLVGLLWAQNYAPEYEVQLQPEGQYNGPTVAPGAVDPAHPGTLPPPVPPPL